MRKQEGIIGKNTDSGIRRIWVESQISPLEPSNMDESQNSAKNLMYIILFNAPSP